MKLVVPDASVLLKWVLAEERQSNTEQALAVRQTFVEGKCDLLLPSLWVYEVANVVSIKQPKCAADLVESLIAMQIATAELSRSCREQAFKLAGKFKVTFYDAAYHALAIVNQGIFVTADEEYVKKVGPGPHLIALKNWR
jgi:predicted nucleic acid-binding protein